VKINTSSIIFTTVFPCLSYIGYSLKICWMS
jgi:hypothetical protein